MTEESGRGRPYGYFALTSGDAAELRARRASGTDADVLAWARQLADGPADRVAGDDRAWEPLRRCLAGRYQPGQGEPVFGRRDHDLRLLDAGQVAEAAAALAGALYSWTEVGRYIRGGRTWVRLTRSDFEYYIDVENADDRIGRIACVDPLIAYWLARRSDQYPVRLED
jgi:hypothetical protein